MLNKRILTLVTLLLFLLLLVGCKAINQAPIITSIPITTVELGETYTYDVNATDPEGDTLTYSLITKPAGMTITSTTGLIKWTPKAEGNFAVAVKVSDGVLYIIQSFTITVSKPPAPLPIVNYAPIITSIPGNTAIIGVAYLYDVNATDPNGDALTYSLTKNPVDMIINSTTGIINWDPQIKDVGYHKVIVKVSDGDLATTQSFTITVKAVEPDPEIELTGIVVDPKTMTLFIGESEDIKSVTATYEIKGLEVPIPLGDCTYVSEDDLIAKVSNGGVVTAGLEGTVIITVEYKDKTDEITVTVSEPVVKTITIRWLEDGLPFYPDGTAWGGGWQNDPIPPGEPATLIQDNGGYHFADAYEYYNYLITPEAELEGSIVISGTGELTGYVTYLYNELLTEDILVGQVEIVIYEEGDTFFGGDHDGTMVGTYTQWTYKFGTEIDVKAVYPQAVKCEGFDDKWLVRYADYTAHGEVPTP